VKKPKSKMEMKLITPQIARQWLQKNTNNRPPNHARITAYSKLIVNQQWTDSNTAITFGIDGTLYDGQNRLMAVMKAAKPIYAWVMSNAPESARPNIDIGWRRSAANWLEMNSVKNSTNVSAALRMIWRHETGFENQRGGKGENHSAFTPSMAMEYLRRYPGVTEFASLVYSNKPPHGIMPATVCAYAYLFSRQDYALAVEFVKGMGEGYNPSLRPAFHQLREMIIKQPTTATPYARNFIAAFIIQAWNAERKGQNSFKRWNGVDTFPTIET